MAEAQVGLWRDPKAMQGWRWKDLQAAMAIEPEQKQKLLLCQISDPSLSFLPSFLPSLQKKSMPPASSDACDKKL
jgi:hypothetical protein